MKVKDSGDSYRRVKKKLNTRILNKAFRLACGDPCMHTNIGFEYLLKIICHNYCYFNLPSLVDCCSWMLVEF
jgi:hypothetical protein